jgi:hypothetical protein
MIAAFDLAKFLSRFAIKSGWIYYTASALFVSYLLYTMIRRRKGERPGTRVQEPEL